MNRQRDEITIIDNRSCEWEKKLIKFLLFSLFCDGMAAYGTCDHFVALSMQDGYFRFVFKNIVGQISIFGKIGN